MLPAGTTVNELHFLFTESPTGNGSHQTSDKLASAYGFTSTTTSALGTIDTVSYTHLDVYKRQANAYYMNYVNQLVLSGEINQVGDFIKINSGKSYRLGLELGALAKISEKLNLLGNLTLSQNKNRDFKIEGTNSVNNLGNTAISFSPNIIANGICLLYTSRCV